MNLYLAQSDRESEYRHRKEREKNRKNDCQNYHPAEKMWRAAAAGRQLVPKMPRSPMGRAELNLVRRFITH